MRGKTEVLYARSTQMPDELEGFMRLAQDKVKVNVIGTEKVGEFAADERSTHPEYKHLAAFIVVHEQDLGKFIRNTKRLKRFLADKDVIELMRKRAAEGRPLLDAAPIDPEEVEVTNSVQKPAPSEVPVRDTAKGR